MSREEKLDILKTADAAVGETVDYTNTTEAELDELVELVLADV